MMVDRDYKSKLFGGLVSGTLQTCLVYPLDVIRVRYFLHQQVNWVLYNGLAFSLIATSLKQSLFFPTQDLLSERLRSIGASQHWADLATGVLFGLATNPINAVKVPLQISPKTIKYQQVIREIYRQHGVRGFYRGGSGVILRDTSWSVSYFPLYRSIYKETDNKVTSSVCASILATSIAYPFDGSRLYQQHHHHKHSFWYGVRESFRLTPRNIKSYFTGVTRVTLATLIGHYTYSYLIEKGKVI